MEKASTEKRKLIIYCSIDFSSSNSPQWRIGSMWFRLLVGLKCVCVYIYIYTHTYIYIYIYEYSCTQLLCGWRMGKSSQCCEWQHGEHGALAEPEEPSSPGSKPTAPLDPARVETRCLLYRCADSSRWILVYCWVDMKVQLDMPWCTVFFQAALSRGQWLCGDLWERIALLFGAGGKNSLGFLVYLFLFDFKVIS